MCSPGQALDPDVVIDVLVPYISLTGPLPSMSLLLATDASVSATEDESILDMEVVGRCDGLWLVDGGFDVDDFTVESSSCHRQHTYSLSPSTNY